MNEETATMDRREQRWHVGKEIPIAVIVAIGIAILSNYGMYKAFEEKMLNHIDRADEKFLEMREYIDSRTSDRIHGQTVREMFRTKDAEIRALATALDKMHSTQQAHTVLLQEILQQVHKK